MSQIRLLLLAAPSGAGKNSFLSRLLRDINLLKDIVTYTTREKRDHEIDGKDYHFVSPEDFAAKIKTGYFAEWAQVHDKMYGTSHQSLESAWSEGKVAIMDIDVQGVRELKKLYPDAISLFILPPSIEELKRRILARDKVPPANLELRLKNACTEMALADSFDYQVINDNFENSYLEFKKIVEDLLKNRLG